MKLHTRKSKVIRLVIANDDVTAHAYLRKRNRIAAIPEQLKSTLSQIKIVFENRVSVSYSARYINRVILCPRNNYVDFGSEIVNSLDEEEGMETPRVVDSKERENEE
jgi:hypothetical protein